MNLKKNKQFEYLDFIKLNESQMEQYAPIAGSYAVVKCSGKYLIGYNTFRQQWELPAGKKEANETSKECAIRELYEETGQTVSNINFVGLLKSLNLKNKSIKFNPVYYTQLDELQPFKINEEISEIKLWDLKVPIGDFDEIDYQLFRYL